MFHIQSVSLILGLALLLACGGGSKKGSGGGAAAPATNGTSDDSKDKPTGNNNPDTPAGNKDPGTGDNASGEPSEDDEDVPAEYTFYMGFDGKTDYGLLLDGDWYSLKDAAAAKVESITFEPSETVKNELIDFMKAQPQYQAGDENDFADYFETQQSAIKISAIKEGSFTLLDKDYPEDSITVIVTRYTEEALALGKKRYETNGAGNLKSCKSCHETGAVNAPPHELGEIMYCSDAQLKTWITTGTTDCYGEEYTASIEHKWGFASDAELNGIVAYLRSKQSDDYETLTKIQFKRDVTNYYSEEAAP